MHTATSYAMTETVPVPTDLTAHPALGALRGSRVFSSLPPGVLARLAACACIRSLGPGQEIELEGRWVGATIMVVRGCVNAVRRTDRELTLETFRDGDVLGSIRAEALPSETLVASETSVVLLLPREDFWAVARMVPEIPMALARELERRLSCVKVLAWGLATSDVEERLYRVIAGLARDQGEAATEGTVIKHFPTQKDLACRVGACRETVCRVIGDLARKNLVVLRGRRLTLFPGFFALMQACDAVT
jgi:CRP-like cAMP-binding protein